MKVPIKSLDQLKELATNEDFEILMLLSGGLASRKLIRYYPDDGFWCIMNYIDDSEAEYASDEEFKEDYPLFFEALERYTLIYENEKERLENYF